ncbi:MAG: TRAP transporter small permease [Stappiaceae bacterium]
MSDKICGSIERVLDFLSRACIFIGSCLMAFMLAIFGWLVFGRYVLNDTPTWVEQLALVLVCYIVFLGAAAGIRENSHLGVTFIREGMPAPVRRVLRLVVDVALAGFGLLMFLSCLELVQFGLSTDLPMLNVPESVRTFPAAVCGALMFVFSSARIVGRLANVISNPDK